MIVFWAARRAHASSVFFPRPQLFKLVPFSESPCKFFLEWKVLVKNSLELIELLGLLILKQWPHFYVPQMALLEFYVATGFQTPVRRVSSTWYLSKDTLSTDVMCQLSHLGPAWVKIRL